MNEELTIQLRNCVRPIDQSLGLSPLPLNECEIPDRDIGGDYTLQDLLYINLYEDWDSNLQDMPLFSHASI